jgi:hypothetical protein
MTVTGALDPAGDHRAESISGGVDLTPLSGVTAELKTVSGSVHSEIENRVEGSRGFWRTVVGDGSATLRINSTSGSLRLLAVRPAPAAQWPSKATPWPVAPAQAPAVTPATPNTQPNSAAPAVSSAPEGSPICGTQPNTGRSADPLASGAAPIDEQSAETWNPEETAEEAALHERDDQVDGEELAVLQALERGEIGVDEAAARLERTRGEGSVR